MQIQQNATITILARSMNKPTLPPGTNNLSDNKPVRKFISEDLLRGEKEIIIEHNNQEYRLRHTKFGKLILTK